MNKSSSLAKEAFSLYAFSLSVREWFFAKDLFHYNRIVKHIEFYWKFMRHHQPMRCKRGSITYPSNKMWFHYGKIVLKVFVTKRRRWIVFIQWQLQWMSSIILPLKYRPSFTDCKTEVSKIWAKFKELENNFVGNFFIQFSLERYSI